MIALLAAVVLGAPTWKEVRSLELERAGRPLAGSIGVADLQVVPFATGPRTLPDGEPGATPPLPADIDAIARRAEAAGLAAVVGAGAAYGLDVAATPTGGAPPAWSDAGHIADVRPVLEAGADRDAVVSLRFALGWCPVGDAWFACVRSPDTALGAGPPSVQGGIFAKRRPSAKGGIKARTTVVWAPYRYRAAGGGWLDAPFLGEGDSFDAQAADAVARAAQAWVAAASGRKRVKGRKR